jgi:radical SAM superfamily enzyme YgiQ (UPF0313 family)
MKQAGCTEISFGIESGNPDILKEIDKNINLEEALRAIKLTRKAGIITHASFILGYIGETTDTIKDTINFAKKLNTHVAVFFIATPLPGSRLYTEALEKGLLRSDVGWLNYSPLSNEEPVLALPGLSPSMLRWWQRKALMSYYLRPSYIIMRLLSIRHWYDIVNLFEGTKILFRLKE